MMMMFSSCSPERPLDAADSGVSGPATDPYTAPLIDRNLFFGDPQYAGAQLSRTGRYITFRKQYNGVMNIWIKGVDEDFEAARPLTADTERPVSSYFWSHDDRYVLYVQDRGGDENFHIYRVDINEEPDPETGVPEAVNLTPIDGIRAQIYSLPREFPDRMIVGINDRDPALHDAYHLDIETGERTLLIENTDNIAGWVADREANIRAGIRQTPDGGSELLMIRDDGFEQVYAAGPEESFSPLRYHEDGIHIYMSTNTGDRDLAEFVLFNPDTRESELIERDPEGKVDFGGATFSEITNEILATYYVGDKRRTYFRDAEYEEMFEDVQSRLGPGEVSPTSRTHDEQRWLFHVGSDVDPGSVYYHDFSSGDLELLYQTRPDLPSEYLSEMTPIRYTARDGLEIPAYLTVPHGMEPQNLPVIVVPHGGPWARDYWGYDSYAQFLSNRGYAVLQINFRGSTGFGKAFLNAGNREWGTGAMQHDITDGVRYLIDEGIADPDRIAIFGGSYGGYATLAGLAFTPDLYAAGISFVGPSNIITLLNSIPAYWGPIRKIFHTRVGDPDDPEDYARLMEQSPLFSAENITAPLMVVQGANDPRVVQAESDQIVVAMRDLGRDVEYLVAEDEGHGFARQVNRLAFTYAMEQFFAEHLGGRYQAELEEEYRERLREITVDVDTVELPEESPELEAAKMVVLPRFDATGFDGTSLEYGITMNVQGNEIGMELVRTATLVETGEGEVLELKDAISSPMGSMTDAVHTDPATFIPLLRKMEQPMAQIEVAFSDDKVAGTIQAGPQQHQIDVALEAPVFAEGIHADFFVSHMVQSGMEAAMLRYFDINSQEVRYVRAVSSPGEELTKVRFEALDGKSSSRTYRVAADGVIHSIEDSLPAQMGGGTMKMTLKQD
ncbi:S9 family peptidase [Balneolales bacterium ANBcel1]|nr:S9 family peptidase [Balneolales bacterium ANBcel1]